MKETYEFRDAETGERIEEGWDYDTSLVSLSWHAQEIATIRGRAVRIVTAETTQTVYPDLIDNAE